MKRALWLLLLLAVPAQAVTIAVTSDATMTTANTTAAVGDVIAIAPGVYDVAPVPLLSGLIATPIRYITTGPVAIRIACTLSKDFVRYYNMAFERGLVVTGASDSLVNVLVKGDCVPGSAVVVNLSASARLLRAVRARNGRR